MTTKQEWLALAERCEKATGLTWKYAHELDTGIALAAGWTHAARGKERSKWWRAPEAPEYSRHDRPPSLSTSLDAITALVKRELPGRMWAVWGDKDCARAAIDPGTPDGLYVMAETAPLALCAAFCRAMAERAEE